MFTERVQSRAEARESTRRRVLAAADRRFRSSGFAATTMRAIAEDAGVSVGTVAGVGEKEALLVAIIDDWIGAEHAARARGRRTAAAEPTSLTRERALDELRAAVEPYLAYFLTDSDLSREFAAVLARGRHPSETFRRLAAELTEDFARVLRAARHRTPEAAARALYLAYLGVLFAASGGQFDPADAANRFVDAADQVLAPGVQP